MITERLVGWLCNRSVDDVRLLRDDDGTTRYAVPPPAMFNVRSPFLRYGSRLADVAELVPASPRLIVFWQMNFGLVWFGFPITPAGLAMFATAVLIRAANIAELWALWTVGLLVGWKPRVDVARICGWGDLFGPRRHPVRWDNYRACLGDWTMHIIPKRAA